MILRYAMRPHKAEITEIRIYTYSVGYLNRKRITVSLLCYAVFLIQAGVRDQILHHTNLWVDLVSLFLLASYTSYKL